MFEKIKKLLTACKWYLFGFYTKFFTKTIVWDFDGTFYDGAKFYRELQNAYWNYYKNNISHISKKKFLKDSKNYSSLANFIASKINKTSQQIATEVDKQIDKIEFYILNKNVKNIIELLPHHCHVILSNAKTEDIVTGLTSMGFTRKKTGFRPFEKIFARESGHIKPSPLAFEQVVKFTQLPYYRHLMIGDEHEIDITPAKKFGFTTLMVYDLKILEEVLRKL